MFALATLIQVFLIRSLLGEELCSRSSEYIQCDPCSQLCPATHSSCSHLYHCPQQCGVSINASECLDVCNENCFNGKCEYTDGFPVIQCLGCKAEFTGILCQEFCPLNCVECHQYNSTCTKCKGKYLLPDCSNMYETTPATPSTTTDINYYSCSSNCRSCNPGGCTECSYGYYGSKCENSYTHCNISLCAMDSSCLQCIQAVSSSDCVTAWTAYRTTTTTGLNCPYPDCQMQNKGSSFLVITGVSVSVFLAISLACLCYQFNVRYKLKCVLEVREPRSHCGNKDPRADGSLATYHGYAYINDRDIDQDRNNLRPPPCLGNNLYESVGNRDVLRESDVESMSSVFTLTGSVLGNLFEITNECGVQHDGNIAQFNQQHNVGSACEDRYEMKYLTPTT